jgi:hypothetical protein
MRYMGVPFHSSNKIRLYAVWALEEAVGRLQIAQ